MSIKLIAIDLDGTLLNSHHQITERVKCAINYAINKGCYVVLATGRPFSGIKSYLAELEINQNNQFCISNNGSVIHNAYSGEHLVQFLLNFDDYMRLEALARQINVSLHALSNNKIYTANEHIGRYTVHESYLTNSPLIFCPVDKMDRSALFTKLMMSAEPIQLNHAESKIPLNFYQDYSLLRSTDYFLECLHPEANKGAAIDVLAKKLNLIPSEIMCIGDQRNDLPMFAYAKHKIAMGNAIDDLKKDASFITQSNNDDGVAIAIEKFV